MKIAIIGGGNMGSAIAGGLSQHGVARTDLYVVDKNEDKLLALKYRYQINTFLEAGDWIHDMDVIVLAVKPQVLALAAQALAPMVNEKTHVISIAAGVPVEKIRGWLNHTDVIRVMPNTPALVSNGISGLFAPKEASEEAKKTAERVMASVGRTFWVSKEEDLHIVTGGSGSGPAYVFLFMEALSESLVSRGFSEDLAREIALTTFEGAAKLARESGEPFSKLRENVTSKGGTTARALEVFKKEGTTRIIDEAVQACIDRSIEMGHM